MGSWGGESFANQQHQLGVVSKTNFSANTQQGLEAGSFPLDYLLHSNMGTDMEMNVDMGMNTAEPSSHDSLTAFDPDSINDVDFAPALTITQSKLFLV